MVDLPGQGGLQCARLLAMLVLGFLVMTAGFDPASAACDAAQSSAYRATKIWTIPNGRTYFVSGTDLDARAQSRLSGVGGWAWVKSCVGVPLIAGQ
jgi:hypothetical protein